MADLLKFGCAVGLMIQDHIPANNFNNVMLIIYLIFCPISIIISFYAYREFKGMMFDSVGLNPGSVSMMPGASNYQRSRGGRMDQEERAPMVNQSSS